MNQIIQRYAAEEADFDSQKALLINVNRSSEDQSLYEATRYAWRLDSRKAARAEFVMATVRGLIVEVFEAHEWLDATSENFPGRDARPGRIGFIGSTASEDVRSRYIGKRIPDRFRRRGSANPVRYTWRT